MKKIISLLVIAVISTSVLFAQERKRPSAEDMTKRQTEYLTKELGLTEDQKTKVESIVKEYAPVPADRPKAKEDREKKKAEREARMAEFQKKREEQTAAIKAVLTDEQKTKYDELLQKQQGQMQQRKKK